MEIGRPDGGGEHLSAAAKRLYGAIAEKDWVEAAAIEAASPGARPELAAFHLIDETSDRPVAREPRQALTTTFLKQVAETQERVARMAALPDLLDQLGRDYQAVQLRVPGGGGSEYLNDPAQVNARLQDVVAGARWEILAAQPGGPRSRELLGESVDRDRAALARGVRMRTMYRDTVRDHPVTAEYARIMSRRQAGAPAQYRTLVGSFERMIIVDREQAFLSDHIVANSPPHSAWLVTDPAVVAVLAKVFDSEWRRAEPWSGELRPRRGRPAETVTPDGDGTRTTRRQREVLRCLSGGVSQVRIARKIGVSKRKLDEEIAAMKGLWGVRTLSELIFQWALSPDRLVDDEPLQPATVIVEGRTGPVESAA